MDIEVKTVCQRRPELCEPRDIKLVAFDCDDTIMRIEPYGIASNIRGPLKKIDDDTVEATEEPPQATYFEEFEPIPPHSPVTKVYDPKTGKWEWTHKMKPGKKPHPLRFVPSYKEEFDAGAVVTEEWWKTPEGEEEVKEIAKELIETLPEKDRKFFETTTGVTGKQLDLVSVPREKQKRWWQKPPPAVPEREVGYKPRKVTIKLMPGFRDTLQRLAELDIKSAVISLNSPGSVRRILDAFELSDKFIEIRDTWENKGKVFEDIVTKHKLSPCSSIFVDNASQHVEEVAKKCALSLVFGKDIHEISEILNYIKD